MKSIQKCLSTLTHRVKKYFKRQKTLMSLKHPFFTHKIYKLLKIFLFIIGLSLVMHSIIDLGIVYHDNINNSFKLSQTFKSPINTNTIVITQISSLLTVLSIISLVANIDNKHILGEKSLDLIGRKFFNILTIILYTLTFLNIYFCIKRSIDGLILLNFILFLTFMFLLIKRFSNLFIAQFSIKKDLLYRYYKSNIKHLKKAIPLNNHASPLTFRLKSVTIKHIRNNDVPQYSENINIYFFLLKISLFNNKKLIQEYFTEPIHHQDFTSHMFEISEELYSSHKYNESLNICHDLIRELNYNRVVLCNYYSYLSPFSLIHHIKNIDNEQELEKYCNVIFNYVDEITYQVYLFSTIDLSYCRLYKSKQIYFSPLSNTWENVYNSILENKYLSLVEKDRIYDKLFDHIRMTEHNEKYPFSNIDDFLNNQEIPTSENWELEIKGEPIALMFLRMFEQKDNKNIYLFSKMNISNDLMLFVRYLTILSILNILYKNNKRKFHMDISIDPKTTIQIIKDTDFLSMKISLEQIQKLYSLISEKYSCTDSDYCKGSFYFFSPRLCFNKTVVDTFFNMLSTKNNINNDFIKECEFNENLKKIIEDMGL